MAALCAEKRRKGSRASSKLDDHCKLQKIGNWIKLSCCCCQPNWWRGERMEKNCKEERKGGNTKRKGMICREKMDLFSLWNGIFLRARFIRLSEWVDAHADAANPRWKWNWSRLGFYAHFYGCLCHISKDRGEKSFPIFSLQMSLRA